MNKRDTLLNLISGGAPAGPIPAAFFLHFDAAHQKGQAAIDKQLEFFRYTGMDLVKVQYEQTPPAHPIRKPEDWLTAPRVSAGYFDATVGVVEGLVKAVKAEALIVLTIYSPFMWARHTAGNDVLDAHLREAPEAVKAGLAIMTENVITLVRACKRAGIDGFYISTQGGESFHFKGTDIFKTCIKPSDLAVWAEARDCAFNILHVCDYEGAYDDLTPFLDYPGPVVNSSLHLGERTLTPREASDLFKRPFMGGLERKGLIAAGQPEAIRAEVKRLLAQAPERFILGADCTVPSETSWDNLKAAIETAHAFRR